MAETPIKVTYLIAIWGETYIRQFMDLGLRSMLSPGNIPALAEHSESTFIFLTRRSDRQIFDNHPLFKRLLHYCKIEFVNIDDLIFSANYSATLTLAYERGMRHAGDARMLSTYFFYLVADYVMADGSLKNLLPHLQRGVSGITSGNFQIVEEDLQEAFFSRIDPSTGIITIPPRELMRMTLPHLHPLTTANVINQNYNHTAHTNRIFWRVDGDTLLGRFYLRHMLCIKPERSDYTIGASCDYSFIDEMCPSRNIYHITDSDEFVVVELQPFTHEQQFIRPGPFTESGMIQSLASWTTQSHRKNAFMPVTFHASDISAETQRFIEESERLVSDIDKKLPAPQLVAHHPYWTSCIDGILENLARYDYDDKHYRHGIFAGIVGSKVFEPALGSAQGDYHLLKIERIRYGSQWRPRLLKMARLLSGTEADCKIWHREYAHSKPIDRAIAKASASSDYFYVITDKPTAYADYVNKHYGKSAVLQKSELFLLRPTQTLKSYAPHASEAIIFITPGDLKRLGELLAKCELCLEGDKHVTIVISQRYFSPRKKIGQRLGIIAAYCNGGTARIESFKTVSNPVRQWLDIIYKLQVDFLMSAKLNPGSLLLRIFPAASIAITNIGYTIGNLLSRIQQFPNSSNPTCAIIRLQLTGQNNIVLGSERRHHEATHD